VLLVGDGVGAFEVGGGVRSVDGDGLGSPEGLDSSVGVLMALGDGATDAVGTLPHPERITSAARKTGLTESLTPTSTFRYEFGEGKATRATQRRVQLPTGSGGTCNKISNRTWVLPMAVSSHAFGPERRRGIMHV